MCSTAQPDPSPNEKYFDRESMNQRCNGNQEIEQQLLSIMRDTLPERLVELRQANLQNDISRVQSIAHQLKGAAGDTSLIAIHESAEKLENYACNRIELIPSTLSELETRIEGTLRELEAYLG